MPVPDVFVHSQDWCHCEMCEKDRRMPFDSAVVSKRGTGRRLCSMCHDCRERCGKDKDYEEYVTDKVFERKLGRLLREEK